MSSVSRIFQLTINCAIKKNSRLSQRLLNSNLIDNACVNCVQKATFCEAKPPLSSQANTTDNSNQSAQSNQHKKSRSINKGGFSWKSLGVVGLVVGIGWTGVHFFKKQRKEAIEAAYLRSLGKPAIGGPFDLIDQDGKPFTSKDLLGKWALLYFGFTHCPDVCPEELEKIVNVVDQIEQARNPGILVPVFITVDPDRDNPAAIKAYLKEFSDKFIGLTGDKKAIDSCSKRYRVYYSAGPKDKDADYIVDHTIIMYLIDPEGKFVSYFGQNKTADEISKEIIAEIRKKEGKKWWFL